MDRDQVEAHRSRSVSLSTLATTYEHACPDNPEWQIVFRFYAALHLVQAYLCSKDHRFDAQRHHERWRAMQESPELRKVQPFMSGYRYLQDVSEQVRYEPGFKVAQHHLAQAKASLTTVQSVLSSKIERKLEPMGPPKSR